MGTAFAFPLSASNFCNHLTDKTNEDSAAMIRRRSFWIAGSFLIAAAFCATLCCPPWSTTSSRAADPPVKPTPIPNAAKPDESSAPAKDVQVELKKLQDELKQVRDLLPDQSHAMKDVSYHFVNLKFAGDEENWPLALFYWGETRSHLRWAVKLKPIRKDSAGREIDLPKILEALETTPLADLKKAIDGKNRTQFDAAYRATIEGCYACHKASDKPYLHPKIPDQPETKVINFDPAADWPK